MPNTQEHTTDASFSTDRKCIFFPSFSFTHSSSIIMPSNDFSNFCIFLEKEKPEYQTHKEE